MKSWLSRGNSERLANCLSEDGSINQAVPWVWDCLSKMPRVRSVLSLVFREDRVRVDYEHSYIETATLFMHDELKRDDPGILDPWYDKYRMNLAGRFT